MKYDKIRGKSVSECLLKIRSLHGNSAMILATREVKEGGLLGSSILSKKVYEIDFMIEERKDGSKRPPEKRSVSLPEARPERDIRIPKFEKITSEAKTSATLNSGSAPQGQSPAERMPEADILNLLKSFEKGMPEATAVPVPLERKPEGANVSSTSTPAPAENRDDERCIQNMMKIRRRLLGARLSKDFTENFVLRLDHSLSRLEKTEFRRVEERTFEAMAALIRSVPDIAPARGECRAVMLIGPTGVGKTTSLAKLAARYHLLEGREVSLYSLDHYRLAATEQLKTYAAVMGLPIHAPLSPDEFREQLRRDGAELMLIDTSGIGHRDTARIVELKKYIEACEVRLEKHLVLAANTSPDLIEKILLAYDQIGFDKILLTKLDEADFLGAFIEHADKFNRPFSFLMNGQDVPGDILDMQPLDLARLILKDEPHEKAEIPGRYPT